MVYKTFNITNFKGIRRLELDVGKKPSSKVFAFVGLNESGKTTILEALHWFYDPASYTPHDIIPKSELLNFNDEIRVKADIELDNEDERLIETFLIQKKRFKLRRKIEHITINRFCKYSNSESIRTNFIWDLCIFGKTNRMKDDHELNYNSDIVHELIVYIEKKMLPPIVYYENFLFNFPDRIYIEAIGESKLEQRHVFYSKVIQDVLNSMNRGLNIKQHILDRYKTKKQSDRSSMAGVLDKCSSKIETEVFSVWKDLLKINRTGLSITLGQSLEEDAKGFYLQVKVKEGDQTYFIRERSLGFRWFFSFILFTHFRAYRGKHFKNALFLLDEPASNLHPSAQTKLLNAFSNFPNEQSIIYATHSHHLINPKLLIDTFVVRNKAKDYSELDIKYNSFMTDISAIRYYQFVAKYPNDKDFYRPILDALDYQPSMLEFVPDIIIVEGKNDYYTLKYFLNVYFKDVQKELYIYPSMGKDKTDYIVSLYIAWGRNFIVLLDDDKGGRRTYERIYKEYGKELKERIYRLNHIKKEWKGCVLEDIPTENDRLKIIKSTFPEQKEYEKSFYNTAIQDCYINGRDIQITSYTSKRFRAILDFLIEKIKITNELLGR